MHVLQCNAHCRCLVESPSALSQTDIKAREGNFCVTFSRNILFATGQQQFVYKYKKILPNKPSILGWYKHLLVTVMALKYLLWVKNSLQQLRKVFSSGSISHYLNNCCENLKTSDTSRTHDTHLRGLCKHSPCCPSESTVGGWTSDWFQVACCTDIELRFPLYFPTSFFS